MIMQSLRNARSIREFENPTVVHNPGADITTAQRNDPAPPAMSHQMVSGPGSRGSARVHVFGKFLPPVVTVPIFHASEARPDCVDWMIEVRPVTTKFPGEERSAPAGINQPPRARRALGTIYRHA